MYISTTEFYYHKLLTATNYYARTRYYEKRIKCIHIIMFLFTLRKYDIKIIGFFFCKHILYLNLIDNFCFKQGPHYKQQNLIEFMILTKI